MGTGDPDLYKAFSWRFWHLVREEGIVGIVLPRGAFSATGSGPWRESVLQHGTFEDTTFLLNTRGWVFVDVHQQYVIGLASIRKGSRYAGVLRLRGPYPSHASYEAGIKDDTLDFATEEFLSWTATASFPLLPSPEAAEVFVKLRSHPRLANDHGDWQARPAAELHATNDKRHMIIQEQPPADAWPVYKGASFDLWNPDTGEYYAWADPDHVTEVLQAKRRNQQLNSRSVFSLFSAKWASDPTTLPCLHPRIAFRDITNRLNRRTMITCLLPPGTVLTNKAPYFVLPSGDAMDESYLLGVLSSIPLDWYARRVVERGMNFYLLDAFPIPRADRDDPLRKEVVEIAGRLAAVDERFSEWAAAVGVPVGSVSSEERDELIARLDAAVALLYGLDEDDLLIVYSTFHEGWNFEPRLSAVLDHYRELASARVGA